MRSAMRLSGVKLYIEGVVGKLPNALEAVSEQPLYLRQLLVNAQHGLCC